MQIELTPGHVILEMDTVSEKQGLVWILVNNKRSKTKGKIINVSKGSKLKVWDHVVIKSIGVFLEQSDKDNHLTKLMTKEDNILLIIKKNMIQVRNDRLLIKPVYDLAKGVEHRTKAGVIITNQTVERQEAQRGEIVDIGEDPKCLSYQKGQIVVFQPQNGIRMKLKLTDKEEEYIFLRTSEILSTL
jgi:co-chaperonin GroES (HSP10)